MEPTTSAMVTAIILGQVRAVLTGVAGYLITAGALQSNQQEAFIQIASGIIMYVVGALWSAYQKKGIAGILKDLESLRGHVQNIPYTTDTPTPTAVAKINTAISVAKDAAGAAAVIVIVILLAVGSVSAQQRGGIKVEPGTKVEPLSTVKPPICDPLNLIPGCQSTTNTTDGIDLMKLWQQILTAALPDLEYAYALAMSPATPATPTTPASPPTAGGLIRAQCWSAIINANKQASGSGLKNPDGTAMVAPQAPANVFTSVEQLAEVLDNLSPTGPLFSGCAAAAQAAKMNVLNFIGIAVTGAAGFAALGVT